MNEDEILRLHSDEEYVDDDPDEDPETYIVEEEDYDFQFNITSEEYDEVIKELKLPDEEDDDTTEPVPCPYEKCKRKFTRRYNLEKHILGHETHVKEPSVCHICGKVVKGLYSLHLKTHDDFKRFRCSYCNKDFRQKITLNNHMLIHLDEKPYSCPYCQRCFRQKYTMQSHVKSFHMKLKNFVCEICDKEFSDKSTLNKHAVVHSTNKPHQCNECSMSFRHKSSLSRHTKTHMRVTKCQLCEKSFRFDTFLRKHMNSVHGFDCKNDEPIPDIVMEVVKEEEGKVEHFVDSKDTIIIYTQETSNSEALTFDSQIQSQQQQQPEC